MKSFLSIIIFFSPVLTLAQNFPLDRYSFIQSFPPGDTLLKLNHQFLIPDSELVSIENNILIVEEEYLISYSEGVINLIKPPQDTVIVHYKIFPFNLRRYYYHRLLPEPEIQPRQLGISQSKIQTPPIAESPFRFQRSGSIFRSITLGSNRDASLQSGMDLRLEGDLGRGTTIAAALSDQNIPLQPQGDTRTLQEIDKVYVNVQSDRYDLNLGDYTLDIKNRQFASLERKLTGVQGCSEGENFQALLSAASSKSEFRSESLTGMEGLQGPYQLHGKQGETNILILAGTEKVWVDGIPKIRGEDYDYIIDYSNGTITFTQRTPIDANSRIVVDFQYSSGEYNRNLYHSAGDIQLFQDKMKLSYALFSEADDRFSSLSVSLTPQAKSALKNAGDDPDSAFLAGATYVGPYQGDYLLQVQSDTTLIYEWVGKDSGEYEVVFSFMGSGKGSYTRIYSLQGEVYYQYAGLNQGDYEPVILLPLPQAQRLADFALSYQSASNINLNFETATSSYDQNTYSPYDDYNNNGTAFTGTVYADSIKIQPFLLENEVFSGLTAEFHSVSENFHPLDRIQDAEYYRKWGYSDTLSLKENSFTLLSYLLPFRNLRLSGGGGALQKDNFSSRRWEAGLDYQILDNTFAHIFLENIRTKSADISGFWHRINSRFWRKLGIFKPALYFEGEDQSQAGQGFRFGEITPSLYLGTIRGLLLEYTYRTDVLRQDGQLEPLSHLNREHILYQFAARNTEAAFDYTHSFRNYSFPDSSDIASDLGRIELSSRTSDGAVIFNLQHRITQSRSAQIALIPIEVAWGKGEYVKVGDQYYPDPNGNYLLLSQPTGEFTQCASVKSSFNLRFEPRRLPTKFQIPALLKLLSSETFFSVEEESKLADSWRIYILYLPDFRTDSTSYGIQTFRQDLFYRKGDLNLSTRFRWNDSRTLNNRLVSASERMIRDDYSFQILRAVSDKISLETTICHSLEKRYLASLPTRNIVFYSLANLLRHQVTRPLELRLGSKVETSRDRVEDISALTLIVNPQLDYAIFGKGRITIETSWIGVTSEIPELPYEMTQGNGKGSNYQWSAHWVYRLGKNLNLTLDYRGESKVARPTIHTGTMELRAFF